MGKEAVPEGSIESPGELQGGWAIREPSLAGLRGWSIEEAWGR